MRQSDLETGSMFDPLREEIYHLIREVERVSEFVKVTYPSIASLPTNMNQEQRHAGLWSN